MTLCGCDPGLTHTGVVLVRENGINLLAHQSWRFRKGTRDERASAYGMAFYEWLGEHEPDVVVMEKQGASYAPPDATGGLTGGRALPKAIADAVGVQTGRQRTLSRERRGKNRDIMITAHVAGVLADQAVRRGIRVIWVSAQDAKEALAWNRLATKRQMRRRAKMCTGVALNEACSDALGIAAAGWKVLREEKLRQEALRAT